VPNHSWRADDPGDREALDGADVANLFAFIVRPFVLCTSTRATVRQFQAEKTQLNRCSKNTKHVIQGQKISQEIGRTFPRPVNQSLADATVSGKIAVFLIIRRSTASL
jgi:hypothetical protein